MTAHSKVPSTTWVVITLHVDYVKIGVNWSRCSQDVSRSVWGQQWRRRWKIRSKQRRTQVLRPIFRTRTNDFTLKQTCIGHAETKTSKSNTKTETCTSSTSVTKTKTVIIETNKTDMYEYQMHWVTQNYCKATAFAKAMDGGYLFSGDGNSAQSTGSS